MKQILCALTLLATASGSAAQNGNPSRERVDIAEAPFSAIAQVNVPGSSRCTGVLVAPTLAVTAAHCLYDRVNGRFVRPDTVHLVLGYDRGSYTFVTVGRAIHLDPAQDGSRTAEGASRDWALVELSEPAPAGSPPMPLATESPEPGARVLAAGFGRDRAHALTAAHDCSLQGRTGNGLLVAACPIIAGYSGGPMIDGRGRLAGVLVATTTADAGSLAIAVPVAAFADRVPPSAP